MKPVGSLARDIVLRHIACDDPKETRERIEIARLCGLLTDDEADSLKREHGLAGANMTG